jgi:hypothetical protein
MDSNMHSITGTPPLVSPVGLRQLAAAVDQLATQDLHTLPDAMAAARVLELRKLVDRLEGQWLRELAGVDGRGAAGAEDHTQARSTASWLRTSCAWAPARPARRSAPPARCSAGPHWDRPGACRRGGLGRARRGAGGRHR